MGCNSSSQAVENVVADLSDIAVSGGPPVGHILLNLHAKISRGSSLTSSTERTNAAEYQLQLRDYYSKGYRLLEFFRRPPIPGERPTFYKFQAIFYNDPASFGAHSLKIVESPAISLHLYDNILSTSMKTVEIDNIVHVIKTEAAKGSRLVGIVQTGMDIKAPFGSSGYDAEAHYDLMFEVPRHAKETYIYDVVARSLSAKLATTKLERDREIYELVTSRIAEGWSLITVCVVDPLSALIMRKDRGKRKRDVSYVCIFEKPASRIDFNTRQYDCNIIEFDYKVRMTGFGGKTITRWDATVEEMGRRGWFLAGIVPSSETWPPNFSLFVNRVLLVFQKPCEPSLRS